MVAKTSLTRPTADFLKTLPRSWTECTYNPKSDLPQGTNQLDLRYSSEMVTFQ